MPKTPEQCNEIRERTKEMILAKSLQFFARNGFAGTKISDLAKHIGIGQGTLYTYFESKEALFQEIQKTSRLSQYVKKLKFLSELPISARFKIHRLTNATLKQLQEDADFAGIVVLNTHTILEQNSDLSSMEATYQSTLYQYTANILEQGQKEGSVFAGNTSKLADYYWGVVYLYALKKLFTTQYEMIDADDLNRIILIPKSRGE